MVRRADIVGDRNIRCMIENGMFKLETPILNQLVESASGKTVHIVQPGPPVKFKDVLFRGRPITVLLSVTVSNRIMF